MQSVSSSLQPSPSDNAGGDARRLALLYDLVTSLQGAASADAVYGTAAASLAAHPGIVFAAFYSLSADGARALLSGAGNIPRGHALAPERIAADAPHLWPVADVVRTGAMRRVGPLDELFADLSAGPWREPPAEAVLLPLVAEPGSAARGVLVLGLAAPHPRDQGFARFAEEIARRVALALVAVEAMALERGRAKSADMLAQEVAHRRRIERQQNLLLDELNHRVRNTLATVQAIAMQTLKGVDATARDTFIARLFALSSQHDLLTLGNWEGASLEGVVRRALRLYREEGRARFVVGGPPVHLSPKRALALGMAFHELATNAARYGAFSNPDGQVEVRWALAPDGKGLNLIWCERGGPPVTAPGPRGFGLRLVEQGLAREIGGTVDLKLAPEGLTCSWNMTLP